MKRVVIIKGIQIIELSSMDFKIKIMCSRKKMAWTFWYCHGYYTNKKYVNGIVEVKIEQLNLGSNLRGISTGQIQLKRYLIIWEIGQKKNNQNEAQSEKKKDHRCRRESKEHMGDSEKFQKEIREKIGRSNLRQNY